MVEISAIERSDSFGPAAVEEWTPRLVADRCLFIDLEVETASSADARGPMPQAAAVNGRFAIRALAAVLGSEEVYRPELGTYSAVRRALGEVGELARGAAFVAGHNIVDWDLPFIERRVRRSRLLRLPAVDTLVVSPLASPQRPYHRLVKDYKLVGSEQSKPLGDCRLARTLFEECWQLLRDQGEARRGLLDVYRSCFGHPGSGIPDQILAGLGGRRVRGDALLRRVLDLAEGKACPTQMSRNLPRLVANVATRPAVAYALAWLSVAGTESVLPRWVHYKYSDAGEFIRAVRGTPCGRQGSCGYCGKYHDLRRGLSRFFGFDGFRSTPSTSDRASLQERITTTVSRGSPVLGIMPTGGGKSVCYQLPAILRNEQSGALTVVISPLQALMKDQVDQLRSKTATPSFAATLNGQQTMIERRDTLDAIRMGRFAMLYVSPEQLRNRSFENAVRHREIAAWVFDEAHCLSQWGHDFRPDYLYAARFIREFSRRERVRPAPVACFTATASVAVQEELRRYFKRELDVDVTVISGDRVDRDNLRYTVEELPTARKETRIDELLRAAIGQGTSGGPYTGSAIVYARTRRRTEEIAAGLRKRGWPADHFHAGLDPPDKQRVQDEFLDGALPVIVATNAFGMGIDKDNIRIVVHADIPGSVESYLQEAGRAGRDGEPADCVLLYTDGDQERQFDLLSRGELTKRDLAQILRAIRRVRRHGDEIIVSPGDLLNATGPNTSFDPDGRDTRTRVKVAIAWLERAGFVLRNENHTRLFQGVPAVPNTEALTARMDQLDLSSAVRERWEAIIALLLTTDDSEAIDIDRIAALPAYRQRARRLQERYGDNPRRLNEQITKEIFRALYDMSRVGVLKEGSHFSAWIRHKTTTKSSDRLTELREAQREMWSVLRSEYPHLEDGDEQQIDVAWLQAALRTRDVTLTTAEVLTLLEGWASIGIGRDPAATVKSNRRASIRLRLPSGWGRLSSDLRLRNEISAVVVDALARIADRQQLRGHVRVLFSLAEIGQAVETTTTLSGQVADPFTAIEKALLFLHEHRVVRLEHGLAMFRQAMKLQILAEKGRRYLNADYQALADHYEHRVFKVHAIGRFLTELGRSPDEAQTYVTHYFRMRDEQFRERYFPDPKTVTRATAADSYQRIVDDLANPAQQAIVTAPKGTNMLVLAGPGSGKTRVVVHRCAYLLKVARVRPERILVICYNRSAMYQLRTRIRELVGDTGRRVAIHTYHSLALRLCERSLAAERAAAPDDTPVNFEHILRDANELLRDATDTEDGFEDDLRDRLLAGYEQVLVDEYQDIDGPQYEMITHIARKAGRDEDRYAAILAVGDDDQNIYEWRGASTSYLKAYEDDFAAKRHYLVENYRSTRHIVEAANGLIDHNGDRMKQSYPIQVNKARRGNPPGGRWAEQHDTEGRVVAYNVADDAAGNAAVLARIERLHERGADLSDFVVISRTHRRSDQIRAHLENYGVPVRRAVTEGLPWLGHIREFHRLVEHLRGLDTPDVPVPTLRAQLPNIVRQHPTGPLSCWAALADGILKDLQEDVGIEPCPTRTILEALHQALAEERRTHFVGQGVTTCTAHAAKGSEYPHVLITGTDWKPRTDRTDDDQQQRRLYYVAMTRAINTLTIINERSDPNPYLTDLPPHNVSPRRANLAHNDQATTPDTFTVLGMADLNLGYPAYHTSHSPIHENLSRLNTHDRVHLRRHNNRVQILNVRNQPVGALAKKATAGWGPDEISAITDARVLAIVRRTSTGVKPEFAHRMKAREWEIPLLEVRHAPLRQRSHNASTPRTTPTRPSPTQPNRRRGETPNYCATCQQRLAQWATAFMADPDTPPPRLHAECGTAHPTP